MNSRRKPINNKPAAFVVVVLHCFALCAFGLDPVVRLIPSDVPPEVGLAAAISGDYIALGAPIHPNGWNVGAVYVFRRLGPSWIQVAKLTAPDGQFQDQLGFSVAMEGDVIAAGAPRYNPLPPGGGPGAVYIFRRHDGGTPDNPWDDKWPFEAKLTVVDAEGTRSLLGYSVAMSGGVIVAGRPYASSYHAPGSVEVYRDVSGQWVHEDSLYGFDTPDSTAGQSVDIYGSTVVMNAHRYDMDIGGVYVFQYEGSDWVEETTLFSDKARSLAPVAITGNHVIAGGLGATGNPSTGAAYVFTRSCDQGWVETQRLDGSEHLAAFGKRIACDAKWGPSPESCLIAKDGDRGGGVWGQLFETTDGQWVETEQLAGPGEPYGSALSGAYAVIHGHVYIVRDRKSLLDFGDFQNCFGPSAESLGCDAFGSTIDHDVNLQTFEQFMATFGGP